MSEAVGTNMNIAIYESSDKTVSVEVRADGDTVWLNRQQLALLFGRDVKTIGKHINNAIQDELADISVVANFATTAADGKTYQVEHYSLDMILAVGYRVKSAEGIHFRRWSNDVLKRYLLEGAAVNNKRIAAALFVYFLGKNGALVGASGAQRISNNALAAITLMIALSRPEEKDVMCLLVMNMLNAK